MANVTVYNMEGKEVGTIELNDAVFGVEINEHLVHMAVVNQLANNRQGTQKAKTRSEVSGGGRKPWRQKGTGHARQGSTRAPQWTGGGVVFAPVPRDYSFKMNKKEKRAALKSALTSRVQANKLIVLDQLTMDAPKTKAMQNVLNSLNVNKALVVTKENNANVVLSARNIPSVKTALVNTINVYDVMKYNTSWWKTALRQCWSASLCRPPDKLCGYPYRCRPSLQGILPGNGSRQRALWKRSHAPPLPGVLLPACRNGRRDHTPRTDGRKVPAADPDKTDALME